MANRLAKTVALAAALWLPSLAEAKPIGPTIFCDTYPDAPACLGGQPACTFCHVAPPERNAFGAAIEAALLPGTARPLSDAQYADNLPSALSAIENQDADADGFSNIDELTAGTYPFDGESFPSTSGCPPFKRNPFYDVCFFDRSYVFKKVSLDFCAKSPSFEDMELFRGMSESQQDVAIDAKLDECVDSEAWVGKDGILWSLAHRKVRPLQAIKSGDNYGQIPLADYDDDYALFVYTQLDNHDARDVLTGQYYAVRQGGGDSPTTYVRQTNVGFNQSVEQARRAGLLTTKWYLVLNIMFTQVPRTAAAQAYRAFLGMDIAKLQGIQPIEGEPVDYDNKGVTNEVCAQCHSTLDPLTYPFTKYTGIEGFPFGVYSSNRARNIPENGYVLGQPVEDLVEWAQVAANSDEFAKATVNEYWKLLLGEDPRPEEIEEFNGLWKAFKTTHNYGVERMLHALIRTEAYGVP